MSADIPPNPSTIVYTTRFYRLVDLIRDERVVEPRLNPDSDLEWLAWAHGARWLIVRAFFRLVLLVSPTCLRSAQRMLFDSRSRAVAHGDASLPLVRRYSDVQDLIEYLDQVFLTLPSQHSYVGEPYPLIAWAPNRVTAEQSDAEVGRPLLPIRYMERPMQLSSFRASSDSLDGLLTRFQGLLDECRTANRDARSEAVRFARGLGSVEAGVRDLHARLSEGVYVPDGYSGIPRRLQFARPPDVEAMEEGEVEDEVAEGPAVHVQ